MKTEENNITGGSKNCKCMCTPIDFNAEEARKISEEVTNLDFSLVLSAIKNVAKKGETECYFFKNLKDSHLGKLNELGFEVETNNEEVNRGFSRYYLIKW